MQTEQVFWRVKIGGKEEREEGRRRKKGSALCIFPFLPLLPSSLSSFYAFILSTTAPNGGTFI
jgi:hypothetical protein